MSFPELQQQAKVVRIHEQHLSQADGDRLILWQASHRSVLILLLVISIFNPYGAIAIDETTAQGRFDLHESQPNMVDYENHENQSGGMCRLAEMWHVPLFSPACVSTSL